VTTQDAAPVRADPELDAVSGFFAPGAAERMGLLIRQSTDEVIATARTRRWNLDQCNDQEKAYLGVNVENVIRGAYDLPDGRFGMDFDVAGVDVDCKWSRNFGGWQIPNEAAGHICLLVHGDDVTGQMAVGLLRIREEILVGGNRDQKRTVQRPGGLGETRWIVPPGSPLPENFLMSLRKRDRDAILAPRGGDQRARELFKRCEGLVIYRHTIESIGQQLDEARRFRGETRARLLQEGFEVLNGHWKKDRDRALELGGIQLTHRSQWVCLRTDGSTPARRAELEPIRQAEAAAYRQTFKATIDAERRTRKRARDAARAAQADQGHGAVQADADEAAAYAAPATRRAESAAVQTAEQLSF
jgi:hypothetical protein